MDDLQQTNTDEVVEESTEKSDAEVEQPQEAKDIENQIDYKAELEKERKAREAAEKALAEKRFFASKKKRDSVEQEEAPDDDDKPLTKSELRELLAEERQANQRITHEIRIKELVKSMAGSDDEADLIFETHKGITFPSHYSLEDQIASVHAIVNRKRIQGENSELKRALAGKSNANKDASGTHQDSLKGKEPQLASDVKTVLTQQGFVFNYQTRRYEKKLHSGKTLIANAKGEIVLAK